MINKIIVSAKERFYIKQTSSSVSSMRFVYGLTSLLIVSCICLFINFLYFNTIVQGVTDLIMCLLFFLFSVCIFACIDGVLKDHTLEEEGLYISDLLFYMLDKIIPGREQRDEEFNAFCEMNKHKVEIIVQKEKTALLINNEIFKIKADNLAPWVNTHIGKEKSLYNLIVARCSDNRGFKKELLYWSQIIPLQRLSVDDVRLLLMSNQIVEAHELNELPMIHKDKIEAMFINYETKDIVKLFTSAYKIKDYLYILEKADKYNLTLVVRKSITDLLFYVKECVSNLQGESFYFTRDKEWISKIEGECELGTIVMIDNVGMLEDWAQTMRNCIKIKKNQIVKQKTYLFGIMLDNQPYIVFELSPRGSLREAKKLANRHLDGAEYSKLCSHLNTKI